MVVQKLAKDQKNNMLTLCRRLYVVTLSQQLFVYGEYSLPSTRKSPPRISTNSEANASELLENLEENVLLV